MIHGYRMTVLLVVGTILVPSAPLIAQATQRMTSGRIIVSAGVGQPYGGIGAAVEGQLLDGHIGAFVAGGYYPLSMSCGADLRSAVGVRGSMGGPEAQSYVSIQRLVLHHDCHVASGGISAVDPAYGWGLTIGLLRHTASGPVLHGGVGIGWTPQEEAYHLILELGVGISVP